MPTSDTHETPRPSVLRMEGSTLIVPRETMALPHACARCGNEPSGEPVFVSFRYHEAHVYLWVLLWVVPYFLFAPFSTPTHPLYLSLCEPHRRERARRRRFLALLIPVAALIGSAALFVLDSSVAPWVLLPVTAIVLGTVIAFRRVDEVLKCTGIDAVESRFEGASPRLLDAPASPLDAARLVEVFS